MAFKEKEMQLKSANNATYKTVEGVTYFKLKSEFNGDYTKHCGLLGEEIDENFYFLRGYDIESIVMDENRNLIINRVDKDYAPIVIKVGEQLGNPSFEFEKETGTVTVTFPDGTTSKMDGFLVEGRDIRMATDSTFNGDGTIFNPLRLSPIEMTGTFAPANEYFDLTEKDGKMPESKGKGYRIVTKEKIDNFGCLYPFSAVERIDKKLKKDNSQWRVATKSDWDELLNALECPEKRNHDSKECKWLGKDAGVALKSTKLWDKVTHKYGDVIEGKDILGLTVYPLGITPDRNEILNDSDNDAEGFGKLAGIWTSTLNEEHNAYVKIFGFNKGEVDQDTYGKGAKLSIRLVKDYNYSNHNEIENILGFPYPTELVTIPNCKCHLTEKICESCSGVCEYKYAKIWTKINFYNDCENLGGIRSKEWDVVSESDRGIKTIYFINEWNGTEWLKKPMDEGDSIVIINYNKDGKEIINHHEWRIINEELIDTAEALKEEFREELNVITNNLNILSGHTIDLTNEFNNFSAWTVETINEFSAATVECIQSISGTVNEFSAATVENINRIDTDILTVSGSVNEFSAATVENIKRIDNDVLSVSGIVNTFSAATVAEFIAVNNRVSELSATTQSFSAATVAEFVRVDETIKTVSSITTSNIERLDERIDNEEKVRYANDITPAEYVLKGDHSEMVLPTNGPEVEDIKIKIDEDFFNFGEF